MRSSECIYVTKGHLIIWWCQSNNWFWNNGAYNNGNDMDMRVPSSDQNGDRVSKKNKSCHICIMQLKRSLVKYEKCESLHPSTENQKLSFFYTLIIKTKSSPEQYQTTPLNPWNQSNLVLILSTEIVTGSFSST